MLERFEAEQSVVEGMEMISAFPTLLLSMVCAFVLLPREVSAQLPGSLTNGLVSYYTFDGNANDSVGTNDATVLGAVLTNGITGVADSAFYFNGISSYMTAGYTVPSNNSFTWALWINPSRTNAVQSLVESMYATNVNVMSPLLWLNYNGNAFSPGTVYFFSYDNNAPDNSVNMLVSSSDLPTNQWTQVAVTSDSLNQRHLYINGQLNASIVASGQGQTFSNVIFGADRFLVDYYDGVMDNVGFWDRPLSSTEVTDLYNAQAVPEPSTYALLLLSGAASLWALKRRKS